VRCKKLYVGVGLTRNFALRRSKYQGGRSKPRRSFECLAIFSILRRRQLPVIDKEGIELSEVDEAAKQAARRGRQIAESDALRAFLSAVA
jgi:hypothetical protein